MGKIILGDAWRGVYPLDKIPQLKPGGYIINTHTSNLEGEHWIALYVKPNLIKAFDSFGHFYPSILVNKLHAIAPVKYNTTQYQEYGTKTCGQYCLLWLSNQYKQT